jgi:hypothetical protein
MLAVAAGIFLFAILLPCVQAQRPLTPIEQATIANNQMCHLKLQ